MATVSIRGKEKLIAHFRNVNQPYWKLYNTSDLKTPIQSYLDKNGSKKADTSIRFLQDIIDSIDPNGTYVLDTYEACENGGKDGQRFLKPDTSICFALSESAVLPQHFSGGDKKEVSFNDRPASLKDHIELIKDNAKLSMEVNVYKKYFEDAQLVIKELEAEIKELNDELDEMAEDDDEEDNEAVGDVPNHPKTMEEALSRIISEHGGVLIENFMDKGVKGDPGKSDDGTAPVNGPGDMPEMNIIVSELQSIDPHFQRHLYKLMLIAKQKPATFKMFISKLEKF